MHIKVKDLERAVEFYTGLLGLEVTERVGNAYAFLSAGEMHHDIALQHVGPDATVPGRQAIGLFHTAFEVPDKRSFAETYFRVKEAGVAVGPTDHRISWAMYFPDPSGNGVEVYCDTRGEPDGVDASSVTTG